MYLKFKFQFPVQNIHRHIRYSNEFQFETLQHENMQGVVQNKQLQPLRTIHSKPLIREKHRTVEQSANETFSPGTQLSLLIAEFKFVYQPVDRENFR